MRINTQTSLQGPTTGYSEPMSYSAPEIGGLGDEATSRLWPPAHRYFNVIPNNTLTEDQTLLEGHVLLLIYFNANTSNSISLVFLPLNKTQL